MKIAAAHLDTPVVPLLSWRRVGSGARRAHAAVASVRVMRIALLLCVLAVLPYCNALTADFTFDDVADIRNNPVVTEGIDVGRIFSSPLPPGDLYRPLTVLTLAINWHFSPGRAGPFHAVNLGLHALVTVLLFILARRLSASVDVASIAAALFAVHPIHTEAVTNLMGRAELLAALFAVATLLCAAAAVAATSRWRHIAAEFTALLCFSLALMSKESALTLLLLVPLVRISARQEPLIAGASRELRSPDWVPYALCAAVFLAARIYVAGGLPSASVRALDNVLAFVPWYVRIASAIGVLWEYFGLLNVPIVLAADYSYPQVPLIASWHDTRLLAGIGLLAAATVVVLRTPRALTRFAVLFPFVALLLTANLLFPIGTIKAERLLYLPSVGWVLVAALVVERLLRTSRYRVMTGALLVVVMAAFAGRTWTRNEDWQSNGSLYRSMVRAAPDSAKARHNYGVALQLENDDEAAAAQFEQALYLYPWAEGAAMGLGTLFDKRGAIDTAIGWYRKALDIDPSYEGAHRNICRGHLLMQRYQDAEVACRQGLRYLPTDANLLKGLGESLVNGGDPERGLIVLRRAMAFSSGNEVWRQRIAELEGTSPECTPEPQSLSSHL